MMRVSEAHGRDHRHRSRADVAYLDGLAKRLAAAACIPPALARKRVMALAISAKPRMEGYRRGGQ
jgi:hypothetical protein